ncbi:MAG TPA: energy transducer TonB [Polyangia bacterium]|nr:energy transducer TonB [Polyangia bacterium]
MPFLGLALLIHSFFILAGVVYYLAFSRAMLLAEGQGEPVDVSLMDNDDEAVRALARELKDLPPLSQEEQARLQELQQEQEEDQSVKAPGQVVDVPKPAEERAPKSSKYVSEYNTSVERETKARSNGKVGAPPGPKAPAASAQNATEKQEKTQEKQEAAPGPLAMRTPGEERPGSAAGRSVAPPDRSERSPEGAQEKSPEGALPERGAAPDRSPPGGGRQGGGKLGLEKLIPTDKQLMRSISGGGGGTNDYLRDVDEGEETALNSKKWKFASFFNRVKRAVAEHWRPDVEYRRRDPTGNVYGLRDRITVLRVALKPDGSLANVIVEQPCGVDFLDDEAITAFKEAQPFPNPPRQLIDDSGMIQFRFAFIFEISSTPTFKVFRYN